MGYRLKDPNEFDELLAKRRVSVHELTRVTRVSKGLISKMRRQGKEVSAETAVRVCLALGAPLLAVHEVFIDGTAMAVAVDDTERIVSADRRQGGEVKT